MSDPFAAYGKQATSNASPRLIGAIKTRAEARIKYSEMVEQLNACSRPDEVEDYVARNDSVFKQFAAELEYLWQGDEALRGLAKEIEWARARVDDGLDFPRWDPSYA